MDGVEVVLERHDQKIKALEKEVSIMREVQAEIRTMNEALVTLATELKHTNAHLKRNESKLDALENAPRVRVQTMSTAVTRKVTEGETVDNRFPKDVTETRRNEANL